MPTIHVIDQDGNEHTLEARANLKLMEVLREREELGVAAICGGSCSCGTCHVYVDPAWVSRLPSRQSDEEDMLSVLTTYDAATSRLSCQVTVKPEHDGLKVTVAPED
jgi:ferredoxin, 2Fe-2S